MDTKKFLGLMEAYAEVYAPQEEIEEASYSAKAARAGEDIGKPGKMFSKIAKSAAKRYGSEERGKKVAGAVLAKLRKEDIEILEDALDEMYDIYLDEAEGSYGQTPKATAAYGKLSTARRTKPATEYSQKGEKTKKVKSAEKHFSSSMRTAADHRGKQSTPPSRMVGRGKMNQDSRDWARERDVEYGAGENKPGSGTVTKNPKKLRKQKALGEIGEGYDIFDVVLEFLQAEGYAETLEEAEWMMANIIDEEAIDIILGEEQLDEGMTMADFKKNRKELVKKERRADDESRGFTSRTAKEAQQRRTGMTPTSRRVRHSQTTGVMSHQTRADITKNPNKLRKQKAMGEFAKEEYVDEAQVARNNPEKYEREQSKKYAPVRGERTPMPPRGDKRREDFEKWYAKQMGR